MAFYCVADEDTVRGFRLAGLVCRTIADPGEGSRAFTWAVSQPDCELLILTEEVAVRLGPPLEAFRLEHERPLIVEIPGPGGPIEGAGGLRRLLRSAVGASLEREP